MSEVDDARAKVAALFGTTVEELDRRKAEREEYAAQHPDLVETPEVRAAAVTLIRTAVQQIRASGLYPGDDNLSVRIAEARRMILDYLEDEHHGGDTYIDADVTLQLYEEEAADR